MAFKTKYKRKAPSTGRPILPRRANLPLAGLDTAYIRQSGRLVVGEQVYEYEESAEPPNKRLRQSSSRDPPTNSDSSPSDNQPAAGASTAEVDDGGEWMDVDIKAANPKREARQARKARVKAARVSSSMRGVGDTNLPAISQKQISDKMNEWRKDFDDIGAIMLSWEAPVLPIRKCACGSKLDAIYRCVECHESPLRCKTCIVTSHRHLWFHYIEAWDGSFFRRYDLISLDFTIYLGHEGLRCPHLSDSTQPSNFVIGHTNGIHQCKLQYCDCPDASDHVTQLLRARLWPATRDKPHSAFTLALLQTWQHLWHNAKITTLRFMRALARYTNNMFPADVKVSIREACVRRLNPGCTGPQSRISACQPSVCSPHHDEARGEIPQIVRTQPRSGRHHSAMCCMSVAWLQPPGELARSPGAPQVHTPYSSRSRLPELIGL